MPRVLAALVVVGAGVAVGLFTLHIVAREPAASFAGSSVPGRLALVGIGWALIGCGLTFWLRRRSSRFGPLLTAAGFAWFLLEWNTPTAGSSLAFTVGLVLYASCPPLAAHSVLSFGDGRLSGWVQRAAVGIAYVGGIVVLGLLPALFYDPARDTCSACPTNLLAVADRPTFVAHLDRVGLWVSAAAACALAVIAWVALVQASAAARRVLWPVLAAGSVYLGLVAAMDAASLPRGLLWNGSTERRLWFLQALALLGVVAGVAWNWLRVRRRRAAVARLVVRLAQSPPPGGLRGALAELVGDPDLELAYPLDGTGRLVDADGRTVELSPELQETSLVAGRRRLAVLAHRPGQLDDEELVSRRHRYRAARARERAAPGGGARTAGGAPELRGRASSRRATPSGGASSAICTTAPSSGWSGWPSPCVCSALGSPSDADRGPRPSSRRPRRMCRRRSRAAQLAHGIFPAVLADGGLAAAVEALAEDSSVPIRLEEMSGDRFPSGLEAAAYRVVAETAAAADGSIAVRASRAGDALVVDVVAHGLSARIERTRARGPRRRGERPAHREPAERRGQLHAEIPCAS